VAFLAPRLTEKRLNLHTTLRAPKPKKGAKSHRPGPSTTVLESLLRRCNFAFARGEG